MKKIMFPFVFLLYVLQSCGQNKNEDYFILKDAKLNFLNCYDTTIYNPHYYGIHNFILYNDSTIYYHSSEIFRHCGTGIDYTKPPFIGITPIRLKKIKLNDLLFQLSQKGKIKSRNFSESLVTISTPTDTIKNSAFPIICFYFKGNDDFVVGVRRCTEEEEVVAKAKFTNSPFDPITHKWKNGFDEEFKLMEQIHFLPSETD